jgi:hypothetical protein
VTLVPQRDLADSEISTEPRKEPYTGRRYLPIGDSSAAYATKFWCGNWPRDNRNLGLLSLIKFLLHM